MLLVESEPRLGALLVLRVVKFANRFLLELDCVFEIPGFSISRGQGIDVIPFIPGIDFAGDLRVFHRLFAIAKSRIGTSRTELSFAIGWPCLRPLRRSVRYRRSESHPVRKRRR